MWADHLLPSTWSTICPRNRAGNAQGLGKLNLKAWLYKLGSRGGSLKNKKIKWARQTGNHSVRVGPNLPGQVGAPLEHTAHHQNLTNWPSSFQSAAFTCPVNFRMALTSISIHPWWGLAIQLLHVGTNNSRLRPMKQSSPALSTHTIGLMPLLSLKMYLVIHFTVKIK